MSADIVVPTLGESVTEATVAQWLKQAGDAVEADEPLVELETDKVTLEVNAPSGGVLQEIKAAEGASVEVGAILGIIGEGGGAVKATQPAPETKSPAPVPEQDAAPVAAPVAVSATSAGDLPLSPAVKKLVEEHGLDPAQISGTGKDGRILKGDVLALIGGGAPTAERQSVSAAPVTPQPVANPARPDPQGREERVKMTRLRQTIAKRLKDAQNTAAMLTTFNEIDMSACMSMRKQYKDQFEKKHGIKLGFMSFFVKAAVLALEEIPAVNAEIQGDELVYKNYYDIGVAVSTPTGLVVPVVRDANVKSFAEIESDILDMATRARDGKLGMDEMMGGTFTITNGGVFGSLNSTPILNAPQSGILGMHATKERPVVVDGEVVVRPMMNIALSYDHRIVDGREAVTFLVRVKEAIEDPQRLLLDV